MFGDYSSPLYLKITIVLKLVKPVIAKIAFETSLQGTHSRLC